MQLELLAALQNQSKKFDLAAMYLGALRVLSQGDNPIRHRLAAHGLRELMEKLPENLNVPHGGSSLGQRTQTLQAEWDAMRGRSVCWTGATWQGPIDRDLQNGLAKVDEFFAQFTADFPRRVQQTEDFLQRVEPRPVPLPETLFRDHVKTWRECHAYFQKVSHHRSDAFDLFDGYLKFLERFLLARLAPRTRRDRTEIDTLIARGETP